MGEKYFQGYGQKYNEFLKTKKMRNVRTINLAVVSRRDLYYVSENESFCFGQKTWSRDGRAGRKSPDFFEPCAKAAKVREQASVTAKAAPS